MGHWEVIALAVMEWPLGRKRLKQFLVPELDPLGREIIELCMNDAPLEAYLELTPIKRVTGR